MDTIKQTPPSKSPGPDGFTGIFYKHYWEIIKEDFIHVIKYFFLIGTFLQELNHTHIVLIPKTDSPNTVNQFRPISLSNVCYKIIAKILANRLKLVLTSFISPFQSAFIPEKFIQENTIIAQEISILWKKTKRKKGLMAIKIDMDKAFDYIEWDFLFKVFRCLGFQPTWINWIKVCITTVSYSIVINGEPHGFIKPTRG